METHIKTEKTPVRDFFLRTVAVLGLIAILLLGAWGIIQLAFAIPNVFSNLGGGVSGIFTHNPTTATSTKEVITVSLPNTVASNQVLPVSWMHANADKSGQYSYAISYACQAGLTVKAPLPNGSYQDVPCNTLFNYVNASQHMNLVPATTGTAPASLAITVTATKLATGSVSAQGAATTNVAASNSTPVVPKPATTVKPAAKPSTTTYYPAATRATNLYGFGDLAVHFTSVTPSYGTTIVTFVIENDGTNVVPAGWTFNATLPINGSYTFMSQSQQALYPGDKIAYVLSYAGGNSATPNNGSYSTGYSASGYTCDGYSCTNNNYVNNTVYPYGYNQYPTNGYQTAVITITADPQNFVQEYNKGNNFAQITVQLY